MDVFFRLKICLLTRKVNQRTAGHLGVTSPSTSLGRISRPLGAMLQWQRSPGMVSIIARWQLSPPGPFLPLAPSART